MEMKKRMKRVSNPDIVAPFAVIGALVVGALGYSWYRDRNRGGTTRTTSSENNQMTNILIERARTQFQSNDREGAKMTLMSVISDSQSQLTPEMRASVALAIANLSTDQQEAAQWRREANTISAQASPLAPFSEASRPSSGAVFPSGCACVVEGPVHNSTGMRDMTTINYAKLYLIYEFQNKPWFRNAWIGPSYMGDVVFIEVNNPSRDVIDQIPITKNDYPVFIVMKTKAGMMRVR